jgi:hypothetical protein
VTGVATGLSPGVFVVHRAAAPLFSEYRPDRRMGLERIAEDGNRVPLFNSLRGAPPEGVVSSGEFLVPVGASGAGPLLPGGAYEFEVMASPGDALSFATMFGASNDWFFGPGENGIPFFTNDGTPIRGDVSADVEIWDVGTERNEEPAVGMFVGPQQSGPDMGPADLDPNVRPLKTDEYPVRADRHLRVSFTP